MCGYHSQFGEPFQYPPQAPGMRIVIPGISAVDQDGKPPLQRVINGIHSYIVNRKPLCVRMKLNAFQAQLFYPVNLGKGILHGGMKRPKTNKFPMGSCLGTMA